MTRKQIIRKDQNAHETKVSGIRFLSKKGLAIDK